MQTEENQNTEPVDIPPVTGPYAEPWSLKKLAAPRLCIWTCGDCCFSEYRRG